VGADVLLVPSLIPSQMSRFKAHASDYLDLPLFSNQVIKEPPRILMLGGSKKPILNSARGLAPW
jgi:hypothetical protein